MDDPDSTAAYEAIDRLFNPHAPSYLLATAIALELRKAEIVIDVQKKVAALLGWPIVTPDPEQKP